MITHATNVEEYVSVVTELFAAQYIKTLDVCLEDTTQTQSSKYLHIQSVYILKWNAFSASTVVPGSFVVAVWIQCVTRKLGHSAHWIRCAWNAAVCSQIISTTQYSFVVSLKPIWGRCPYQNRRSKFGRSAIVLVPSKSTHRLQNKFRT